MELTFEKLSRLLTKPEMAKLAVAAMRPSNSSIAPKAPSQKMPMPAPTASGAFSFGKKPPKGKENLSGVEINPGGNYDGSTEWINNPKKVTG